MLSRADLGMDGIYVQSEAINGTTTDEVGRIVNASTGLSPSLALGDVAAVGIQLYGGTFRNVQIVDNVINGVSNGLELDQADNFGIIVFRGNRVMDISAQGGVLINTTGEGQLIATDNLFDLDPYFLVSSRGSKGT